MDSIPSHMSSNVDKHYPTIIHVKYKNDKIFYYTCINYMIFGTERTQMSVINVMLLLGIILVHS